MSEPFLSCALLLPQWQGYAADDGPQRGAREIATAIGSAQPWHEIEVASWHLLRREPEAGFANHGQVLGLREIDLHVRAARRWLDDARPARLLTVGGDCGSDFSPLAWQLDRFGDQLGVLYLDAHADLNTPASSPSARFHGMILRAVLGDGADALTSQLSRSLTPAQLVMAGVRDLDAAERDFLAAVAVQPWPSSALADGTLLAALQQQAECRLRDNELPRLWHIHFDLDVLDPQDFPEVTVPTPGGATLAAMTQFLVELVTDHDVVGLSITEHVGGDVSARRIAETIEAVRDAGWR